MFTYMMDGKIPIQLEEDDVNYAVLMFQTALDGFPGRRTKMQVISQLRFDGITSREKAICLADIAEQRVFGSNGI